MIRTIKIDVDAFERLDDARRGSESLSEVIKRCVPRRRSYAEIIQVLSQLPLSNEALNAVEESAVRRRRVRRRRS